MSPILKGGITMAKKFLSRADAAKKLKVSEKVIQEMINSKVFESKLVGKNVKIDEDSLNEWLENLNESEEKMLALKRVICHFEEYMRPENIFLTLPPKTNTTPSGCWSEGQRPQAGARRPLAL